MRVARLSAAAAVILGIGVAALGNGAAGTGIGAAIFVANSDHVNAYPVASTGDVPPIALTPDMIFPAGIARDGSGRIYITNPSTNTITVYPADASGNVAPLTVIGGSRTRLASPGGIALDANGQIYVLNGGTKAVTVYPSLGSGTGLLNEAPIAEIAGGKTKLKEPVAIAVDGGGDIYVANQSGGPPVLHEGINYGAITVYAAGSKGNIAPSAIIRGTATGLILPVSIAVDSKRNIYIANTFGTIVGGSLIFQPNISVYPAGSEGDAAPTNVINGASGAIAVDSGQNIYTTGVTSDGKNFIAVYPAGSNGNVAPIATIVGADTGLNSVSEITLDADGDLYVANDGGGPTGQGSITVYSSGASGDAAPINTITSSFTGINFATGIAMDSSGKIYLTNELTGPNFNGGSVLIFPAGSYATGTPASVITGADTGLNFPQKVALDARGNISVLNFSNVITVYPAGSAGNVTPDAALNIRTGNLGASGIARGFDGELYVADQGNVICNNNGNCHQTSVGAIDIYPARANGNASPGSVIVGHNTNLSTPSAIAVSRRGNIFVANQGPLACSCGCFPQGPGSITVYAAGSADNALPIATIQGPQTRLHSPSAIAVDGSENIYVVDGTGGGIGFIGFCFGQSSFPENATNQNIAMMKGPQGPGVWFLPTEFLFGQFDSGGNNSILTFKAGSDGDTPPIATIHGPFTGLEASGIAIGPSGH